MIYPLNNFIKLKNLIPNQTGEKHQSFASKENVPLSGGLFILVFMVYILKHNFLLSSFLSLFFLLGLMSDKKLIVSPYFRFILQSILISVFVVLFDLKIIDLRNSYINHLISYNHFSFIFIIICFMVLINGSNFIDGLNGLAIGHYLIVFFILFTNSFFDLLNFDYINSISLIIIFLFLLILNFNNKLFLGDSGSYLISILTGYFLIKIYNLDQTVSPFFIAVLLWYPCFENLFSIIRKFNLNSSPLRPDNKHLHQLIFIYIKKKFKYNVLLTNNISSVIINFVNLFFIIVGSLNYSNTILQIFLILCMTLIYIKIYISISKKIRSF